MKKLSLAVAVVLCASFGLWAQSIGVVPAGNRTAPTALTKHVLKATYVSSAVINTGVGSSYQALDAANNVVCPGTAGSCLIQADQWVEAGAITTAGNRVALCLLIDGNFANGLAAVTARHKVA